MCLYKYEFLYAITCIWISISTDETAYSPPLSSEPPTHSCLANQTYIATIFSSNPPAHTLSFCLHFSNYY